MATAKVAQSKAKTHNAQSSTPILDAYLADNPHKKTERGWDKEAASKASAEFASLCTSSMTVTDAYALMKKYVPITGWKGPTKHLALKLGVITSLGRD